MRVLTIPSVFCVVFAASAIASETPFCDGNQTTFPPYAPAIACPCSVSSPTGLGCVNGATLFAELKNAGSDSATAADAELVTTDMPANKLAFTYFGQSIAGNPPPNPNPMGLPFGNGVRCINAAWRLPTSNSGSTGSISYKLFQTQLPPYFTTNPFVTGSTWLFQTFYRDDPVGTCSPARYENMSNGWSITFT